MKGVSNKTAIFTHMNETGMGERSLFLREVEWVLHAPPLLMHEAWSPGIALWPDSWLDEYDASAALHEAMKAGAGWRHPSGMLGKQFETVASFCLKQIPSLEVMAEGVRAEERGRTLGELDMLIRDTSSGEWIHLEMACKYYLGSRTSRSWQRWVGLNPADRLDIKVARLEMQLALSDLEAVRHQLPQGTPKKLHRAVWLTGFFFVPFDRIGHHPLPEYAHPQHCGGWWARVGQLSAQSGREAQWIVLPRKEWLARWESASPALMTGDELIREIRRMPASFRGCMVVQAIQKGSSWIEVSRGMVVPDKWPG